MHFIVREGIWWWISRAVGSRSESLTMEFVLLFVRVWVGRGRLSESCEEEGVAEREVVDCPPGWREVVD